MQHDYWGQYVIAQNLDLRSNIDLTDQSHYVYVSTHFDEGNTIYTRIILLAFLVQKLFGRKNFLA